MKKALFILAISLLSVACSNISHDKNNSIQEENQTADWAITAKVKAAIMADLLVSAKSKIVTVNTTNGVVTLSGGVSTQEEKERIEQTAMGIHGVKKVNNQLTVTST